MTGATLRLITHRLVNSLEMVASRFRIRGHVRERRARERAVDAIDGATSHDPRVIKIKERG